MEMGRTDKCSAGGLESRLASLSLQKPHQFSADLVEAATIGLFLFVQDLGNLGREFKVGLGILLELQVHHFFEQSDQGLGSHIYQAPGCQAWQAT